MSKQHKSDIAGQKEVRKTKKHLTAPPRLEGKVKNTGIKPEKKPKKTSFR